MFTYKHWPLPCWLYLQRHPRMEFEIRSLIFSQQDFHFSRRVWVHSENLLLTAEGDWSPKIIDMKYKFYGSNIMIENEHECAMLTKQEAKSLPQDEHLQLSPYLLTFHTIITLFSYEFIILFIIVFRFLTMRSITFCRASLFRVISFRTIECIYWERCTTFFVLGHFRSKLVSIQPAYVILKGAYYNT